MDSKASSAVRESAVRATYEALERMLVIGLTDLEPAKREAVRRCVMEGGAQIEFTVVMGAAPYLVCSIVAPNLVNRDKLFRVELGDIDRLELQ